MRRQERVHVCDLGNREDDSWSLRWIMRFSLQFYSLITEDFLFSLASSTFAEVAVTCHDERSDKPSPKTASAEADDY
jgi:hypothetical protein